MTRTALLLSLMLSLGSYAAQGTPIQIPQQSGCCSWHNGVCGCSGGRAVCCDGSYSPSCGCRASNSLSTIRASACNSARLKVDKSKGNIPTRVPSFH